MKEQHKKQIPTNQPFSNKKHFTKSKKELKAVKERQHGEKIYSEYIGSRKKKK